jgi:hypothetical protein
MNFGKINNSSGERPRPVWRDHFALFPVELQDHRIAWLETVETVFLHDQPIGAWDYGTVQIFRKKKGKQ